MAWGGGGEGYKYTSIHDENTHLRRLGFFESEKKINNANNNKRMVRLTHRGCARERKRHRNLLAETRYLSRATTTRRYGGCGRRTRRWSRGKSLLFRRSRYCYFARNSDRRGRTCRARWGATVSARRPPRRELFATRAEHRGSTTDETHRVLRVYAERDDDRWVQHGRRLSIRPSECNSFAVLIRFSSGHYYRFSQTKHICYLLKSAFFFLNY